MSTTRFRVAADHPCLPGHFPDDPIVPGVLILAHVIDAVTAASGQPVTGVRRCKFTGILRPEMDCVVTWQMRGDNCRFECTGSGGVLARGELQLGAAESV